MRLMRVFVPKLRFAELKFKPNACRADPDHALCQIANLQLHQNTF